MPSRIRLIRCVATVAILALALGAGCDAGIIGEDDFTTDLSPENRLALGERDIGKVLDLQPFQVATIEIPANISTGFVWNVDEIDPRLTVIGSEYVQDSTGLLGSAGRQIFYVVGNDPGKAGLRLTYARPMESHNYLRSARFDFQVQARYAGNFRFVPREEPQAPIDNPTVLRASLPTHFSWCEQGACPPIRDQGDCGGCWAFGTAGVFESALMRAGFSSSPNLSEQYLISCNNEGFGCNGGWWAHDYHVSKKVSGETEAGAVNESVFPYTASDSYCNPPHAKVAKLQSWAYVKDDSSVPTVDQLKTAIYNNGPLAVAVCVNTSFENYSGGVFTGPGCTGVNHAVILVGWDDGDGAWIMRNTWGTSWGENGYMRIKYGVSQIGYAASYVVYGGGTTGPTASFSANATGLTVAFSDTSMSGGSAITSWSWNFGDGGTSTSQNPTHTYAAAGSYTVTLTVTDGAGKTSTASQTVTVASPTASYCAAQGNDVSDEWIAKVAIGSFANASGAAGYSDFTAKAIPVSPGGSYAVTFTPGFSGSAYKEYWGVWIDFNGDKDFSDSGEQVLSGSGTAAVSGTLAIPATASLGQTRLRIAMRYNVAPSSCGSFDYGEVEDYTIEIASGGGGPAASFAFAAQGLTVSFTDTSTAGGSAIASRNWSFGDGTTSNVQNPSHTYAQGGTYAVTLTVTDAGGLSSSATQNVTVAAPTAAYCAAQGNNSSYEWLSKVQIDSFTKSSGAAGYSDFTGTVIPLATGSHSIALTPSFSGTSYTEYFRVWIDLDGNGDFAGTGELVFSKSGKTAVSGTLTIPTTAILGPTRMRIAMKYNSAPSSCGSFSYGEVEDYTVQIAP